ncbi:MAG: hypothetical protein V7L12_03085 [Nostoc sp.]
MEELSNLIFGVPLWLKRQAETGDFQGLANHPSGNSHKITHWEKFPEFALSHGDKTQVDPTTYADCLRQLRFLSFVCQDSM